MWFCSADSTAAPPGEEEKAAHHRAHGAPALGAGGAAGEGAAESAEWQVSQHTHTQKEGEACTLPDQMAASGTAGKSHEEIAADLLDHA